MTKRRFWRNLRARVVAYRSACANTTGAGGLVMAQRLSNAASPIAWPFWIGLLYRANEFLQQLSVWRDWLNAFDQFVNGPSFLLLCIVVLIIVILGLHEAPMAWVQQHMPLSGSEKASRQLAFDNSGRDTRLEVLEQNMITLQCDTASSLQQVRADVQTAEGKSQKYATDMLEVIKGLQDVITQHKDNITRLDGRLGALEQRNAPRLDLNQGRQ